jgi:hypothetical protein
MLKGSSFDIDTAVFTKPKMHRIDNFILNLPFLIRNIKSFISDLLTICERKREMGKLCTINGF